MTIQEASSGLIVARTNDVPEPERLDFWCKLVAEHLGPVDVAFVDAAPISGEMRIGRLGTLPLVSFWSTPFTARRSDLPAACTEAYAVTLQLSGTLRVQQENRLAVLAAGDYCVYDTVLPYTVEARGESESLILLVPHGALDLPVSRVREQSVIPLRAVSAASAVAGSFLLAAGYALHEHGGLGDSRISDSFMSLFSAAIADDKPDPWESGTYSPGDVIVDRVKAYVIAHLSDPDLTPATVAAAHHISVRYLHKVFEREPVTVMELIRNSRLEACARDLADARLLTTPVGSIGSAHGIPDASTFSRLFRATYGVTPRDYRAARLGAS